MTTKRTFKSYRMTSASVKLSMAAAVVAACGSENPTVERRGDSDFGSVGMNLTVAPGVELTTLDWSIYDAQHAVVLSSASPGQSPWNGGDAESIGFVVGGVPVGGPYTIQLDGETSNGDGCDGTSREFNVAAGATTSTAVNVECGVPGARTPTAVDSGSVLVNGTVTSVAGEGAACPAINDFAVSPTVVQAGGSATLHLETAGPTPTRIVWSSTAGTVTAPNSADTSFNCGSYRGTVQLTATLEAGAVCVGVANTTRTVAVTCEGTVAPRIPCTTDEDCGTSECVDGFCAGYPASCRELASQGAVPGSYVIDTDGSLPNAPFTTYCQTTSQNLAPVGLCQSASGAPPACKSFVGAVGYGFQGVRFDGAMRYSGLFELGGANVIASQEVIELADGSMVTAHSVEGGVRRYHTDGTYEYWTTLTSNPIGVVQLLDGHILVSGGLGATSLTSNGSPLRTYTDAVSFYSAQGLNGRIWVPEYYLGAVHQFAPDGTDVGSTSSPGYLPYLGGVLHLADGRSLVLPIGNVQEPGGTMPGAIYVFGTDGSPIVLASAPTGMTLQADGSLTRADFVHTLGAVQLPNGQIVIANTYGQTLTRLNADLSYVDSLNLSTACSGGACYPSALTLDHRGRLLVSSIGDYQLRVVTFPGCSDGERNFTETGVDCGGECTARCPVDSACSTDADCASGNCDLGFCTP